MPLVEMSARLPLHRFFKRNQLQFTQSNLQPIIQYPILLDFNTLIILLEFSALQPLFIPITAILMQQITMQTPKQPLTLKSKQLEESGEHPSNAKIRNLTNLLNEATANFVLAVSQVYQNFHIRPSFQEKEIKRIILAAVSPVKLIPDYNFVFPPFKTYTNLPNSMSERASYQIMQGKQNQERQNSAQESDEQVLAYSSVANQNSNHQEEEEKDQGSKHEPYIKGTNFRSLQDEKSIKYRSGQLNKSNYLKLNAGDENRRYGMRETMKLRAQESQEVDELKQQQLENSINRYENDNMNFNELVMLGKWVVGKAQQSWSVKKCQIQNAAKELSKFQFKNRTPWAADYLMKNQTIDILMEAELSSVCACVVTTVDFRADSWKNGF